MIKIKPHIKPLGPRLLPEGDHIVVIDSIQETINKDWREMPWDDKTPQLAIRFKNSKGYITQWINLKGYMTEMDYNDPDSAELDGVIFKKHPFSRTNYAVDLHNNRIENEQKTVTCLFILSRIAFCAGCDPGSEIDIKDLIGRELAIRVSKVSGQLKVTHTFKKKP